MNNHDLRYYRTHIDVIDAQIVDLLNQRAEVVHYISRIKQQTQQTTLDSNREEEIYARLFASSVQTIPHPYLRTLYQQVLEVMRTMMDSPVIYYLGPTGTFSHQAAVEAVRKQMVPDTTPQIPVADFASIFALLRTITQKHYAILPVHNTSVGTVAEIQQLLATFEYVPVGELSIPIHLNLATKQPTELSTITHVYSKQEALDQCSLWLDANVPQAERVAMRSTCDGVSYVKQDVANAVICGPQAIEQKQLHTMASAIEDQQNNQTTFVIISNQ